MKISKTGYKKNSKDKNQPFLLIPSNQITMKGVEFPVLGTDNTGYSQMMYPGLDYSFPGSYVYELPMGQDGGYILPGRYRNPEGNWLNKYQSDKKSGQVKNYWTWNPKATSERDSMQNIAGNILNYEILRGGPGGSPLTYYSDPEYMNTLMNDIYPQVKKMMPNATPVEMGEAMDLIFNSGWDKSNKKILVDPRAYAIQEYYRVHDKSKLDKEGNWAGRKATPGTFDSEYANTVGKLSENERRVMMNKGRDWFYQHRAPKGSTWDLKTQGAYPDYGATWYGRIWNTNDYAPFNPNNPKFIYPYKTGGEKWLDKYQSKTTSGSVSKSGPRIENLPLQKVDNKLEIAYDGSTVYVRKIGEEKFTTLNPEKSKAFIQKYQEYIPPSYSKVEEQKKKQAAYNAKVAAEKKEMDELLKYTPLKLTKEEKDRVLKESKDARAELAEKSWLDTAWDATKSAYESLPDVSDFTNAVKGAYESLPDAGNVIKLMNLSNEATKLAAAYAWNYKIPENDIPGLRSLGELSPKEIYQSFENRFLEKNFGEDTPRGESNIEELSLMLEEDATSGTSDMQQLKKSRAKYGPQRLPARRDSRGNMLPSYQPTGGNDSLARFSYTFNNDILGADTLPPTHFVTPKVKELTGNPARPRKWDNAFAVGDFLRDADITENQFYHPDKYYVGSSLSTLRNSDLGIRSNKLISASNQLLNDPEKYWALYKWEDPKNPLAAWARYMKTDEIKSRKEELEKQGWHLDMPVSAQHRFDDVDWFGKGSDTNYKAESEWVPLKPGAKNIKSQKGATHTYIPQGTKKGQDNTSYDKFSGGSITFIWTDPETKERLASSLIGSVSDMKQFGDKLKKDYGLKEGELEFVYHDTGSYSGKPAAKDGTLYYDQWKDFNVYNKGYSGAALIVPTQDWLENWTPNKKEGGQLNQFQKGGFHQKIYTDSREFAKANKLYNDSLDLYTKSLDFNKKNIPHDNYNSFTVPYDDVLWTADGPGGYFIDTPFGRKFLGKSGVFSVPGSEHNKIFTESFTNKIKPIGFDTVDWPYPVYKKPTQEPVYEEIKNLPYLDAKFERPDFKLDIGKPPVKSQGIRIRPMMTADQTTSTGQYQSGKYMWDPETKSWKVKMLSPETQQENKKEVRMGIKKYGGWLDKYQDGKQVNKPLTFTQDPELGTVLSEVNIEAEKPFEVRAAEYFAEHPPLPSGAISSVPFFEAALMAPTAFATAGRLLSTKIPGLGLSANNIINPYFAAKGIQEIVDPQSDLRKAASRFKENPSEEWRSYLGETLLTSLNFAGVRSLPKDARAILKSNIVRKPVSKLLKRIPDKRKLTPELYRQHAIEADNAIRTEGHEIIKDLSSEEGVYRLKEQFRKADPKLTEEQLNYLVVNRISEVNTALQKNTPRFYLEHGMGAEGTLTHGAESEFFPYKNAHWVGSNPYSQVKDITAIPRSAEFPGRFMPIMDNSDVSRLLAKRIQFTEPSYMPGTISIGTGYPNKTRVIRHEAAHATQGPGAGNLPLEDDLLRLVKPSGLKDNLRHVYKYLTDPRYSGDYKYFTGKNNTFDKERYAFLAENRSKMKDLGIIDDTYSKIDYGKLKQAARNRRLNPSGDNRFINLYPSWKWNKLADIMNVAPSAVPYIVTGTGLGIGLGLSNGSGEPRVVKSPVFKSGGWLDKYQDAGPVRRDPNQPFFESQTEPDTYESQYSQPEVTITPDWTEAELERNRLRDEYIKKDKNIFRHWYDKLGYDKDNVTKRATQHAYNKLAKEYLKGDREKLTPEQIKFIEKSEYANRLQPSVGSRFVEGVTNPGFNLETVGNLLAPLEYPGNLVRGVVKGEFADAVKGQTPSPYFVSSDLAGTSPAEAAIISGLTTAGTDPLFLTGDEIFGGVGQGAKALRKGTGKYFNTTSDVLPTSPLPTQPSKPLQEITDDVDPFDALLDDMDMNYDPSITGSFEDMKGEIDPDIFKSMKDKLKGIEKNEEAIREQELEDLAKQVPEEFAIEARAAGAEGAKFPGYYTDAELQANLQAYNEYMDARRRFSEGYNTPFLPEEMEKEFELLFPNVKLPQWNKQLTKKQANELMIKNPALYRQFFGDAANKLTPQNLKKHGDDLTTGGLWNHKLNSVTPEQRSYDEILKLADDPNAWYMRDPKEYLTEMLPMFNHELSLKGINTKNINLEALSQEQLSALAEQVNQLFIESLDRMRKSIPGGSWQNQPKGSIQIPFRPEQMNKYGGSPNWLDKYQDGSEVKEMPFGLPLRDQNPYLVPEYNQPMANGYILPDPYRPQLMNTGATEYKDSHNVNGREVQVPSIVAGQYLGEPNRSLYRYMISGEEFKPMADPGSYSKFYDMIEKLGLMKQKKGGEMSPSMGYFNYIGGYRGMLP